MEEAPLDPMIDQISRFSPYAVGFVVALFVGQFFIWKIVEPMWASLGAPHVVRRQYWHAIILGSVERVLFVGSVLFGKPEFIAAWLALKVAGQWRIWTDPTVIKDKNGWTVVEIAPRNAYNIFLVGNALSVGFSVLGAQLIEWGCVSAWPKVWVAIGSAIVGATLLWCYARAKASSDALG